MLEEAQHTTDGKGGGPYLIVDLWEEKKGRFRNSNKNSKVSRSSSSLAQAVSFSCTPSLFPEHP